MLTRLPFDSDNDDDDDDDDTEGTLKLNGKNEDERYPWMINVLDGDKRPPSKNEAFDKCTCPHFSLTR